MAHEGKYIYCIINGNDGRNFGPIGIGGRGDIVSTIGYNEISAVFSNTPMSQYVISRENLTDHEKVIEKVMQDYTILPARFCTIASNAEEIRTLLRRRYSELKGLFRKMDNKVEMGVKISWKNLNQVLREIAQTDSAVQDIRSKSQGLPILDTTVQIEAGKALHRALCQKKEEETWPILNRLRRISVEVKENPCSEDKMVLNAVCLIDRTHEREFDFLIDELVQKYEERFSFKYVGPAPPYNFVNIEMTT